eukprot:TRINITY_DN3575_c0_g1_i1.p1 TRINITY_DN3575_c0_g1~~TRINITY_DN3575_c0_g1_i1.p1  ORF type:complete len:475 (+),score=76.51 TRINITY_DN3575_c0_g1_i1:90-1514(+)
MNPIQAALPARHSGTRQHRSNSHTHGVIQQQQQHRSATASSSSASPSASNSAIAPIPIDDHRSVGSTFWQGWLKYRQTMQEKEQNILQKKKGHCDRFYPFWSLFGFTAVSFASLVVWWATELAVGPWFLLVVFFYVAAWRISSEIRSLRRRKNILKRGKYLFRLHATLAALSVAAAVVCCSVFDLAPEIWISVATVFSCLLSIHYLSSFVNLRKLWLMPLLFIYLICVTTLFLLWYAHWKPTESDGTIPLWLWVMAGGAGAILLQFLVFLLWNNWAAVAGKFSSISRVFTEVNDAAAEEEYEDEEQQQDDAGYTSAPPSSNYSSFSLNRSPVRASIPLTSSGRKYPSYSAIMQAGGVDASAHVASGAASGNLPAAAAEHRSGYFYPSTPANDAIDIVEYVETPKTPFRSSNFSHSEDAAAGSSPIVDTVIEVDALSPVAGFEPSGSSPFIDVFVDGQSEDQHRFVTPQKQRRNY